MLGFLQLYGQKISAGLLFWEWDINSFFEPSSYGGIQSPGDVCCSEHEHSLVILPDSLHLHEKLCHHRFGRIVRWAISASCQRINFVDENNGGLLLPCHLEQRSDKLGWFSDILWHQIRRGHRKEGCVALCGARLGQKCFPGTRRPVEQNSFPRFSNSIKYLREFCWKNHRFLQRSFGLHQPGDIIPLHVWLLGYDGLRQGIFEFLLLFVFLLALLFVWILISVAGVSLIILIRLIFGVSFRLVLLCHVWVRRFSSRLRASIIFVIRRLLEQHFHLADLFNVICDFGLEHILDLHVRLIVQVVE